MGRKVGDRMNIEKEKRAIECLKEIISPTGHIINISAVDLAIEALEKQIATKVLSYALTDKCGSCMEALTHQSMYCPWCGQRLDWKRRTENGID